MQISLDAGALCSPQSAQFGTAIFTKNLLRAISLYDRNNRYTAYTFCDNRFSAKNIKTKELHPSFLWMTGRITIEELLRRQDIFLGINQSLPLKTYSKTIVFSHGLSFYYHPEFYVQNHHRLQSQLEAYTKRADHLVVTSERVKTELSSLYPRLTSKLTVIPCGVPFDFLTLSKTEKKPYFLFVGDNHPIKQIEFLIDLFGEFNKKHNNAFRLLLIGPHTNNAKNVKVIRTISRNDLKNLYAGATGYLSASKYESFNFPAVEALSQNCPILVWESAVTPELKQFVYSASSPEKFLASMETLLQCKPDPQMRARVLQTFSWKKFMKKLVTLYT